MKRLSISRQTLKLLALTTAVGIILYVSWYYQMYANHIVG